MIVFLFSSDLFSWNMHCIMTTKLEIVTIFVFRSHTAKARKCIRYHIPMLLNTLPVLITAKLYTHSQIGFVNYTKQLLLNGYSNRKLLDVLKRDAVFFYLFYLFL